ncbi:MAG: hypothetical protein ACI9AR_000292 [Flavobacteriaceae bacterium]|jgi:hypothetical protein
MIIKVLFGVFSSIFILVGGIPYLIDIHKKKAQPHILSWLGWAFITALGAFAMMAEGSTWVVTILFANTLLCLSVVMYSIIKKTGVWSTSTYDFIFFGFGILGLVLWQALDIPLIALVSAILADFFFGLPTIIKTFKDPKTETPFVWITATISGLLSLFAAQNFSFHEIAYPLYLFIFDIIVLLLVLKVIRKTKQK